jgi:hypothetical protein
MKVYIVPGWRKNEYCYYYVYSIFNLKTNCIVLRCINYTVWKKLAVSKHIFKHLRHTDVMRWIQQKAHNDLCSWESRAGNTVSHHRISS